MATREHRTVGDDLSPAEREILALLCSGEDAQSARAREQLQAARWAGYAHEDCECFLITVAEQNGRPVIGHDGGPFSMLEVSAGHEALGLMELWVVGGYLHSVDYTPFGDDHDHLPTPDEYSFTLADRG